MGALSMTSSEREEFLAGLHVGVLAVERSAGPPLITPIWYRYSPGGDLEFNTERVSEKARLMGLSGRASLCAQSEAVPYAYVTVEGPVELVETTRQARVDLAVRYLGEEMGQAYVDSTAAVDDVLVRLSPQRWRTTDYAKLNLPAT
jgi:PPOX class probable F420-dependent enzyme